MADVVSIDPRTAWEPYRPSPESPWDLRKVGHLYRRAAFGATADQLQAALKAGPEQAIDALLQGGPEQEALDEQMAPLARSLERSNNGPLARVWWLYRLVLSPQPLREKLTLFWHNHFATSNAKVRNVGFMLGQYELLRRHALGNFRTLLQEISRDPAMLIWLDTNVSKKEMPNENYARELMELFSLGRGNYTEADIRDAAKAFTGWSIQNGKAVFSGEHHDAGSKTVLGQTGHWTAADIVRICLDQKAAPAFICRKLFRFLVSETIAPTPELIEPLADRFRKSDFDFGALVRLVLRSNLFFSREAYRSIVKSPVDFALEIVHGLEGHLDPDGRKGSLGLNALSLSLEQLGQSLFYPPSVKGWDGGQAWLNGQTLLFRQNLALALTSTTDGRFGRRLDPAALAKKHRKQSDADLAEFFLQLFLQGDVTAATRAQMVRYQEQSVRQAVPVYWTDEDVADRRVRSLCHLVLALPEFQLC
jgi:uncharacterized protein (DUF1800 family)